MISALLTFLFLAGATFALVHFKILTITVNTPLGGYTTAPKPTATAPTDTTSKPE